MYTCCKICFMRLADRPAFNFHWPKLTRYELLTFVMHQILSILYCFQNIFMKKIGSLPQVWILVCIFFVSRIISFFLGLHLNMWALTAYWQYLDLETLQNHLLNGLWYDHAQPPVFNLLLGMVLKTGGSHSALLFAFLLKMISLVNGLLLFSIVRKLIQVPLLPLLVALAYILSPATLLFECELFYTTSISLLLLISVFYLIRITESGTGWNAFGVIIPLALLCLTRSVFH